MKTVVMEPFTFGTPIGSCHCGCGQTTNIAMATKTCAGWIKGTPKPYLLGHSSAKSQEVKEEKFWLKVSFRPDGCWEWTGHRDDKGYGTTWEVGAAAFRSTKAHRMAYRLIFSNIPDGLELDHLCRHRECVNPWHLEPISHLGNMRRGANTRLTDQQVREILLTNESRKVLADKFGISTDTVAAIKNRKDYRKELP